MVLAAPSAVWQRSHPARRMGRMSAAKLGPAALPVVASPLVCGGSPLDAFLREEES